MTFKEFAINEGWFSKMKLGPKMLKYGDKKKPQTSYGGNYRSAAIARKWQQIQDESEQEKQKRLARLRGSHE